MDIQKEWHLRELKMSEEEDSHRPLEVENSFYSAVSSGDMDAVRANLSAGDFTNPEGMGKLSNNALTNLKYHFVVTVAMITRHCVDAGMELEQAYRLSDFYILKMDSLQNKEDIATLHASMVMDFTGKMLLLKKQNVISKSITQCIEYIYNHIHDRITVEDLAEYTELSPSYLSRLFKKELGISVSDYIREKKIDKAQNLLKYSDFSMVEIANYLSFSSQSHFIQTFEKLVGQTPKKYRDRFYRASW